MGLRYPTPGDETGGYPQGPVPGSKSNGIFGALGGGTAAALLTGVALKGVPLLMFFSVNYLKCVALLLISFLIKFKSPNLNRCLFFCKIGKEEKTQEEQGSQVRSRGWCLRSRRICDT